jgi:hypothetical protein
MDLWKTTTLSKSDIEFLLLLDKDHARIEFILKNAQKTENVQRLMYMEKLILSYYDQKKMHNAFKNTAKLAELITSIKTIDELLEFCYEYFVYGGTKSEKYHPDGQNDVYFNYNRSTDNLDNNEASVRNNLACLLVDIDVDILKLGCKKITNILIPECVFNKMLRIIRAAIIIAINVSIKKQKSESKILDIFKNRENYGIETNEIDSFLLADFCETFEHFKQIVIEPCSYTHVIDKFIKGVTTKSQLKDLYLFATTKLPNFYIIDSFINTKINDPILNRIKKLQTAPSNTEKWKKRFFKLFCNNEFISKILDDYLRNDLIHNYINYEFLDEDPVKFISEVISAIKQTSEYGFSAIILILGLFEFMNGCSGPVYDFVVSLLEVQPQTVKVISSYIDHLAKFKEFADQISTMLLIKHLSIGKTTMLQFVTQKISIQKIIDKN